MRRCSLAPAATLALAALSAAAQAQEDRPPPIPTRDVAISYRVSGGAAEGQELHLSWLADERRVRADFPGDRRTIIADLRAGTALVLGHAERTAMAVPLGRNLMVAGQIPADARLTRGDGDDRVAGIACAVWHVEYQSYRSAACLAPDGVLLRLRAAEGARTLEATRVEYGPQDPARFRLPEGYRVRAEPR
jgi:hypothetical protein